MSAKLKSSFLSIIIYFLCMGTYQILTGYFDSEKLALANWSSYQIRKDFLFAIVLGIITYITYKPRVKKLIALF